MSGGVRNDTIIPEFRERDSENVHTCNLVNDTQSQTVSVCLLHNLSMNIRKTNIRETVHTSKCIKGHRTDPSIKRK